MCFHSLLRELESALMGCFIMNFMLGDHSPWISLHVLLAEALAPFCSGLSFQNVYTENSLETQESCFSMEQRLDLLTFLYNKDNVPFWGKGWHRFACSTL